MAAAKISDDLSGSLSHCFFVAQKTGHQLNDHIGG